MVAPPSLSGAIRSKNGRLQGTAKAVGDTPAGSLLIYQDGLLTKQLAATGVNPSWKFDIDLLPGTRWVSMVAVDKLGLAAYPWDAI